MSWKARVVAMYDQEFVILWLHFIVQKLSGSENQLKIHLRRLNCCLLFNCWYRILFVLFKRIFKLLFHPRFAHHRVNLAGAEAKHRSTSWSQVEASSKLAAICRESPETKSIWQKRCQNNPTICKANMLKNQYKSGLFSKIQASYCSYCCW